jgi:hypothetical protein
MEKARREKNGPPSYVGFLIFLDSQASSCMILVELMKFWSISVGTWVLCWLCRFGQPPNQLLVLIAKLFKRIGFVNIIS